MNNWRLLLLAIVAVVQPIASFTDRNLIDGRQQQCCDRPSSAPLRDTRSSLHGTYRLSDTTSTLRSLSDRDETRDNRRSTERRLMERERAARQDPASIARSSRIEYRLERSETSRSRERLLDAHQREGSARHTRDLKLQEFTRRDIDRTFRNAVERRDARAYTESSRDSSFRVDYTTERFGNERLSKNSLETRREMQSRPGDRRITLNRDARHVIRNKEDDETIYEVPDNMNIRQRFTRERISVVRRESDLEKEQFRQERRNVDQRRSLTENTRLDRIRDMRALNGREENRENRRISYLRSDEKFGERREQNKENSNRRQSERMQMSRRDTRESRIMTIRNERNLHDRKNVHESRIINSQNRREVDSRREMRNVRDEIKENLEQRLSRVRILMDQRNIRESRNTNTPNVRHVDNRQEIRYNERDSRNTQDEMDNHNNILPVDRVQVHRRNIREFRVMNNFETRDGRRVNSRRAIRSNNLMRDTHEGNSVNSESRLSREMIQMERRNIRENIDSRREIRYDENRLTDKRNEIRQNREQKISRERPQMDRRTQEFRKMNNIVIRQQRDAGNQREIRNEVRLHSESSENPEYRLSRERTQMERRNSRESRIVITPHERDTDSRQEIKNNERVSREPREEIRENADRNSMTRGRSEVDRRNIRDSRIMYRVTTRYESDMENRRGISVNERLSSQVRGNNMLRMSRLESRSTDRVAAEERDNSMLDRRTRSVDRRHFRDIRGEARLNRSVDAVRRTDVFRSRSERTNNIENKERESIDSRSRSVKMAGAYERTNSVMVEKMETENNFGITNWQYVLYTLQAAYVCALFVQMLKPNPTEKTHKMKLHWLPLSSHYNPIKVD